MKTPRPILVMSGGMIRPRTIREQVDGYLSRMRHTLPLPCSVDDLYFGLVPPAVKQWHGEGLFEMDSPLPGRRTNLLLTMYQTSVKSQTAQPNILHVSVEEPEEYLEAQRGNRGYEGVFWFGAPDHAPVPRNSTQTPFFLPKDHPFHDALNDWVEEAFKIEDEIQDSLKLVEQYCAICKTPTQVTNTWPELMNFVNVPGARAGLSKQVAHELRQKVEKTIAASSRNEITTQLTRAVMLPEQSPALQAWVKFYTKEIL